jgi:hypothetical protein
VKLGKKSKTPSRFKILLSGDMQTVPINIAVKMGDTKLYFCRNGIALPPYLYAYRRRISVSNVYFLSIKTKTLSF